jgi:hypothetical protein
MGGVLMAYSFLNLCLLITIITNLAAGNSDADLSTCLLSLTMYKCPYSSLCGLSASFLWTSGPLGWQSGSTWPISCERNKFMTSCGRDSDRENRTRLRAEHMACLFTFASSSKKDFGEWWGLLWFRLWRWQNSEVSRELLNFIARDWYIV